MLLKLLLFFFINKQTPLKEAQVYISIKQIKKLFSKLQIVHNFVVQQNNQFNKTINSLLLLSHETDKVVIQVLNRVLKFIMILKK